MKIHHIITGLSTGGAERNLSNLVQWTKDACEHEVTVLTTIGPIGQALIEAGVHVRELGIPRGRISLRKLFELTRILRRSNPDIVQTWMWHSDVVGGVVSRLSGCRCVFWNIRSGNMRDVSTSKKTYCVARCAALMSKFVPARIIVNSIEGQRLHEGLGYAREKFFHIPNGFDTDLCVRNSIRGSELRIELKVAEDAFVFINVGRFEPPKQHGLLLRAFAKIAQVDRNVMLFLVGRGCESANAELKNMLSKLEIESRVCLLGEREDVTTCLSAADAFVSSSSTEGFPNAIAEAMCCNVPCVVTDVGDSARLVGESGIVVSPQNVNTLSQGMGAVLSLSNTERNRRGLMARQRIVDNFSREMVTDAYLEAWGVPSGINKASEDGLRAA